MLARHHLKTMIEKDSQRKGYVKTDMSDFRFLFKSFQGTTFIQLIRNITYMDTCDVLY